MTTLSWILVGGILMSAIALVGSLTLIMSDTTLRKILLPLVSFAAGSLVGGALFNVAGRAYAVRASVDAASFGDYRTPSETIETSVSRAP